MNNKEFVENFYDGKLCRRYGNLHVLKGEDSDLLIHHTRGSDPTLIAIRFRGVPGAIFKDNWEYDVQRTRGFRPRSMGAFHKLDKFRLDMTTAKLIDHKPIDNNNNIDTLRAYLFQVENKTVLIDTKPDWKQNHKYSRDEFVDLLNAKRESGYKTKLNILPDGASPKTVEEARDCMVPHTNGYIWNLMLIEDLGPDYTISKQNFTLSPMPEFWKEEHLSVEEVKVYTSLMAFDNPKSDLQKKWNAFVLSLKIIKESCDWHRSFEKNSEFRVRAFKDGMGVVIKSAGLKLSESEYIVRGKLEYAGYWNKKTPHALSNFHKITLMKHYNEDR